MFIVIGISQLVRGLFFSGPDKSDILIENSLIFIGLPAFLMLAMYIYNKSKK
jgi:hypothetical protein